MLSVIDSNGKVCFAQSIKAGQESMEISTSGMPAGMYIGSVRKLGCKQQAYAHSFVNLKRKKGISATPLNWLLNAFTLALNDSAPALVCLFTK